MVEGVTSTKSLQTAGAKMPTGEGQKVQFKETKPKVTMASANLAANLSKKEQKAVRFSPYGDPPFEDADMFFITLYSGQYREEYEKDDKGNLYSGGRGRGHLPQKKVIRRYPHMIDVPIEEHCNNQLFKLYDKGFCLEEDMPEDVKKELKEFRKEQKKLA